MYYHEMMDPTDVLRRIYDWTGDRLTSETADRMQQWLSEHPQNRFAPNKYNLDESRLSVDMLA